MKVYLVWCGNDEINDMLVGVADTREQAEKMKEQLEKVFECIRISYSVLDKKSGND